MKKLQGGAKSSTPKKPAKTEEDEGTNWNNFKPIHGMERTFTKNFQPKKRAAATIEFEAFNED